MTGSKVSGEGDAKADIMFVGEAPGKNEARQGRPFVGASGRLFRSVIASKGIIPSKVWIDNVCKHRPPANKISRWIKTGKKGRKKIVKSMKPQVAEGIAELFETIARVQPTVIVPMGNTALWALTGNRSITKYRGSILKVTWDMSRARHLEAHGFLSKGFVEHLAQAMGTKVIPTLHPAAVLRRYEMLALFQTDIGRIKEDSEFPELRLPERDVILNPPEPVLRELETELLNSDLVSYDIECIGHRLYCVGFTNDPSWAVTVTTDRTIYMDFVRNLVTSPVPMVAQNGPFDASFLEMFNGLHVNGYQHDTMIAQHTAYPELPKGLDTIASIYTREPYFKDEGKDWKKKDIEDVERFLTYNAKDVCVTMEAMQALLNEELEDPGYRQTYERVMSQTPVYIDMMVQGIRLDTVRMVELERQYREEYMELQKAFDEAMIAQLFEEVKRLRTRKTKAAKKRADLIEAFLKDNVEDLGSEGGAFNVNSTSVMPTLIYDILGHKEIKRRRSSGKRTRTTDEDALKELYTDTGDPYLLSIVKIRQKRKRISSYLQIKTDGASRTYFSMNPVGTETGRSSCGKTITGYGLNMQTIPHELRDIFIPENGYRFAYCDLGQAEARIVAYRADVRRMIEAFEHPDNNLAKPPKYAPNDVHSVTAHQVLGIPYDEMEEYPHRYLGKTCNHAFNYEMGPYKFWRRITKDADETGVTLTRSQAKAMRQKHFRTYPELEHYWEEIRAEIRSDRTLVNPMGRKRVFLGRMGDDTFREAFSHYAQSTVADILRTGMVRVHDYLCDAWRGDYPQCRIVLEVHDAILVQYPIEHEDEIIPKVKSLMKIPVEIKGREIVIPVDAAVGPNWLDMKTYAS